MGRAFSPRVFTALSPGALPQADMNRVFGPSCQNENGNGALYLRLIFMPPAQKARAPWIARGCGGPGQATRLLAQLMTGEAVRQRAPLPANFLERPRWQISPSVIPYEREMAFLARSKAAFCQQGGKVAPAGSAFRVHCREVGEVDVPALLQKIQTGAGAVLVLLNPTP